MGKPGMPLPWKSFGVDIPQQPICIGHTQVVDPSYIAADHFVLLRDKRDEYVQKPLIGPIPRHDPTDKYDVIVAMSDSGLLHASDPGEADALSTALAHSGRLAASDTDAVRMNLDPSSCGLAVHEHLHRMGCAR